MLESILPGRYRVSKAFVVDADGGRSEQIDLLIYDRHFSPVLVDVGEYLFIPAEAAYAALEVKQELSRETIRYAGDKVASVRRLRRTSAPIPHAGGTYEPRPVPPILGGLLTMDAGWTGGLSERLGEALGDAGPEAALDLGCALRAGSFEVTVRDQSPAVTGSDTALIFFVLRLLQRLQGMASAPAIAYEDYASVLVGRNGPRITSP